MASVTGCSLGLVTRPCSPGCPLQLPLPRRPGSTGAKRSGANHIADAGKKVQAQERKPLSAEDFERLFEVHGIPVEDIELIYAVKDLVEAAHGIKESK